MINFPVCFRNYLAGRQAFENLLDALDSCFDYSSRLLGLVENVSRCLFGQTAIGIAAESMPLAQVQRQSQWAWRVIQNLSVAPSCTH